jgi:pimeloyl-ACP methyl ester carboxylesterase
MSINALFDPSPDAAAGRVLLVMLPGVNDRAASFFSNGIVQALRERRLPVDALGIDVDFPAYADGSLLPRLHGEIDRIDHRRGIERLWFVGTSLGAMGALMYCRAHPGSTDGVVLLAPYLASRRVLVQIAKAGGLDAWRPEATEPGDMEWRVLDWLRREVRDASSGLRVHLGYGRSDPFALGSTLLQALLPAQRSIDIAGTHDWPTWSALWASVLDQDPFQAKTARAT